MTADDAAFWRDQQDLFHRAEALTGVSRDSASDVLYRRRRQLLQELSAIDKAIDRALANAC